MGTIFFDLGDSWKETFSRAAMLFFVAVSGEICCRMQVSVMTRRVALFIVASNRSVGMQDEGNQLPIHSRLILAI